MFVFVPGLLRDQTSGRRGRTSNTWVRGRRRRKSFLAEEFHLSGLGVPKPRVGTGRGNPRKHTNTHSRTHSHTHTHGTLDLHTFHDFGVYVCACLCLCTASPNHTDNLLDFTFPHFSYSFFSSRDVRCLVCAACVMHFFTFFFATAHFFFPSFFMHLFALLFIMLFLPLLFVGHVWLFFRLVIAATFHEPPPSRL